MDRNTRNYINKYTGINFKVFKIETIFKLHTVKRKRNIHIM